MKELKWDWETAISQPRYQNPIAQGTDMGNIAHLSNRKEMLDLQDRISMSVYQARAVLIALSSDDNFETLHKDDISGCLHVILDRLEDIKREVDF